MRQTLFFVVLFSVALLGQSPAPVNCCDVNGDGVVDVRDVQIVLNTVLSGSCSGIQSARDIFTKPPFVLAHKPSIGGAVPMVFLNGLLQRPGSDYKISSNLMTFTAADLGESPTVQVAYWY